MKRTSLAGRTDDRYERPSPRPPRCLAAPTLISVEAAGGSPIYALTLRDGFSAPARHSHTAEHAGEYKQPVLHSDPVSIPHLATPAPALAYGDGGDDDSRSIGHAGASREDVALSDAAAAAGASVTVGPCDRPSVSTAVTSRIRTAAFGTVCGIRRSGARRCLIMRSRVSSISHSNQRAWSAPRLALFERATGAWPA
jgi:hypothetical protein